MEQLNLAAFYGNKNTPDFSYAGGEYDTSKLLGLEPVRAWMNARRDQPVTVADIGCGRGVFLVDITKQMLARYNVACGRAIGVDFVRYEPNRMEQIPAKSCDFIVADLDGERIPLKDGAVDLLVCNHVLEHLFHTESVVSEMCRVLAHDGLAVISVPNLAAWVNRVWLLFGCQPIAAEIGAERVDHGVRPGWARRRLGVCVPAGHIRAFTPRGLLDLCRHAGLEALGWWNQDERWIFRMTAWSGRNVGITAAKAAPSVRPNMPESAGDGLAQGRAP